MKITNSEHTIKMFESGDEYDWFLKRSYNVESDVDQYRSIKTCILIGIITCAYSALRMKFFGGNGTKTINIKMNLDYKLLHKRNMTVNFQLNRYQYINR